ncbi:MAG: sel1 repeat family protein [Eubacterium sp.]|nr:sel1 repeat family protein [Eubacterium sp.]
MTIDEARKIAIEFDKNRNPTEEDVFLFTEAMGFLIEELHDPDDMLYLGGYYYEQKRFDLALKYYEMSASFDYDPAYECLGYIWYYGRTGERDYKKAYEYFSKLMAKGHPVATYKVADMYKNGYFVEKDQAKYEEIIEELYTKVKHMKNVFDPLPEVYTRLARIRIAQGKKEEATDLLLDAKDFQAQRLRYDSYFGNLNIMKWLIDDLYELIDFDEEFFDFYDLYYLLKTPHKITFYYDDNEEPMTVESVMEGEECSVCFNGKWFHSRDDFFAQASVDGTKLTAVSDDLYGFEVMKDE